GHKPLSPEVVDKLLDLLSHDNEFRKLFQKDATAALAKAGHPPAQEMVAKGSYSPSAFGCMATANVAPAAEIQAARVEIKSFLTSDASHTNPHCFEAGQIESTLRSIDKGNPTS
ncbi:MAG: NHLP-related RiPP peptide, partial [Lysobacter sp.]